MATSAAATDTKTCQIIDGKAVAARVTDRVAEEARRLNQSKGLVPGLAVVLLGSDPASEVYVRNKGRTAEKVGFLSRQHTLPAETSEADLLALVDELNRDKDIHGILVQLPLPKAISATRVIEAISPEKDVDGFHPINVGRLTSGLVDNALVPCTPAGCMVLLEQVLGSDYSGKSAVVVGRSTIVGRPVASLLLHRNATVTITHSRTADLPAVISGADIVIAAIGRAEMIKGAWLKPGATVIDVGINRIALPENPEGKKSRLVGDVAFAEAVEVAGAITPVPGGVGPMTIAMLMANTLVAACRQNGLPEPDLSLGD